jgi:hypothetical protein
MEATRTAVLMPGDQSGASLSWRRGATALATIVANIALFMVLFQLYKLVRRSFIMRAETVGFDHAHQIIRLEKRLDLFFEPNLQHWVMQHEWLIRGLNWYYAAFMWSFYLCCIVALALAPERFHKLRRVFLLSMVLALPWYAIYPLAPPRMMTSYGLVDTLRMFGPNYFSNGGLVTANQFAAMPSMHIGWSTIGGLMLAAAIPYRRIGAMLGGTHIAMMTLTVMATGNHYFADVIGGWLIVAVAFALASMLPDPLPWAWRSNPQQHTSPARPAERDRSADPPVITDRTATLC